MTSLAAGATTIMLEYGNIRPPTDPNFLHVGDEPGTYSVGSGTCLVTRDKVGSCIWCTVH